MSRHRRQFSSVRSEGGLLPQDLLSRIQSGDKSLPGLTPETYNLGPHERIGEAVNRAWSRLNAAWHAYEEALAKEPDTSLATGLTRDRWLLPLFQELGYGRLPKGHAIEVEGKNFAVSHAWHLSPIHLLGSGVDLDRRQAGVAGAAKASPHGLLQEFLNRSDEHLWGFVSNGLQLRVLRDHHSLTRQAYIEFDLQAIMQGEQYSDFLLLWAICHQSRVEAEKPEDCWLERWFNTSRDEGVRALDKLRGGVEKAIEAFGTGFLAHKANAQLHAALESRELDKQEYYRQLLRLVYRLIFLFVAEEREALLDPDASAKARNRYLKFYATHRLRALADQRRGGPHGDVWNGLRLVMSKLDDGCSALALPALGSRLWDSMACPWLMKADCGNEYVLDAIRHLSNIQEGRTRYPVNWRNVGADELGSIYEGLLELHPRINKEAITFQLDSAAGHERKTTGSYYTPTELVDCLLDSALDPVIDEATKKPDPEQAILDLKVCDPACGSGHFLVAAARRIAKRLAAARAGEDEPSPQDVKRALRDVVGRCIYGVDMNPMAVELCKVSLWLEAIEPGRPLSFLDSHIQCGNALLGSTPALMASGIPDDAFKPIEGDDSDVAKRLKKRNAEERKGQATIFAFIADNATATGEAVATQVASLEAMTDIDIDTVRQKERRWERLSRSSEFKDAWLRADAWCCAFIWPKQEGEFENGAITHDLWQRIQKDVTAIPRITRRVVRDLARRHGLFHWHLAFPTVFREEEGGGGTELKGEERTPGSSGGFDAVLGNPPWERIKLQEKEFFAARPEIANAANVSVRKQLIDVLRDEDPESYAEYSRAKRFALEVDGLLRQSGRFPLCGRGDVNTYSIFAELNTQIVAPDGRVGCILPTGIATDTTNRHFFREQMHSKAIVSLHSFYEIRAFFLDTDSRLPFCLLTLAHSHQKPSSVGFFLRRIDDIEDKNRVYDLTADDVKLLNPVNGTCPVVQSTRSFKILRRMHERSVIFEDPEWSGRYMRLVDLGDHSGELLFRGDARSAEASGDSLMPLLESKLVYVYDHRFGTFDGVSEERVERGLARATELDEHSDPNFKVTPRYWIRKSLFDDLMKKYPNSHDWFVGYRDVTNVASRRTCIACAIPRWPTARNTLPVIATQNERLQVLLVALLSSRPFDYAVRQKVPGNHLSYGIFKQLPLLHPDRLRGPTPWSDENLWDWLRLRLVELVYTSHEMRPFAVACEWQGGPFQWQPLRRAQLQYELDGAMAHLYGLQAGDLEYLLDDFNLVRDEDTELYGDYRTKVRTLGVYNSMQRAIDAGEPYRTPLNPPPSDSCATT